MAKGYGEVYADGDDISPPLDWSDALLAMKSFPARGPDASRWDISSLGPYNLQTRGVPEGLPAPTGKTI